MNTVVSALNYVSVKNLQVLEELSSRCLIRYNKSRPKPCKTTLSIKDLQRKAMFPEVPAKARKLLQILARSEACAQPTAAK